MSAATAIYNQEGINQFIELKALSDDGKIMHQAKHLIAVVYNPSGVKDGHVINACTQ